MQLFYTPNIEDNAKQFTFPKDESKHIVKVLRKQVGDILHVTNGKGYLFEARLDIADQKNCVLSVIKASLQQPLNYKLHLVVAPTKMNDRYEWFLEKATEIGVTSITPIICDHSERKTVKIERYQKIIQSALKQSLSCYYPILNQPITFKDYMSQTFSGDLIIAHCEKTNKKSFKSQLTPNNEITVLIGPEGDFSLNEIQIAIKNKFIPVTLGDTRLRTETAAIVACHSVAFINQ